MKDKVKVAIDGAGGMGRIHAFAYLNESRCELLGFCSRNKNLLAQVSSGILPQVSYGDSLQEELKIKPMKKSWQDLESLAEDDEVQAVSICLPNALHYEHAKVLLENGKHVLIEKPMAVNAQQCIELTELARKHNLLIQIGHMWRFHPEVRFIKRFLEEKKIGDIVQIKGYAVHEKWSPAFFGPSTWFINKSLSGGGALLDMGVHAIDTINFLLGDPGCESVYARIRTAYDQSIKVEDCVMLICNYKNGVVCYIESAWNSPFTEGNEASVLVFGTKGYARLFPTELRYEIDGKWVVERPFEDGNSDVALRNAFLKQTSSFIESIISRKEKTLVPGEVGAEVLKICDAAYLSEKLKQLVFIK